MREVMDLCGGDKGNLALCSVVVKSESDISTARMPTSPADLMLRMINHMVDSYLDLIDSVVAAAATYMVFHSQRG